MHPSLEKGSNTAPAKGNSLVITHAKGLDKDTFKIVGKGASPGACTLFPTGQEIWVRSWQAWIHSSRPTGHPPGKEVAFS